MKEQQTLILYPNTIQKTVKNHPVKQLLVQAITAIPENTFPALRPQNLWDLREGMEKRGWKSMKSPFSQCWSRFPYGCLKSDLKSRWELCWEKPGSNPLISGGQKIGGFTQEKMAFFVRIWVFLCFVLAPSVNHSYCKG